MEALNEEIVKEIVDFIKSKDIGASASEIAKGIDKNRITVSKYLEVMGSKGVLESKQIAQAKYWQISNGNKPRVLIVDDDKNILELVRLSLVHKDYDIVCANDGVEALELVRKEIPDLIVLDLMMPNLDGMEVCRDYKAES